jgi:hypothetical protein
VNWTWKCVSEEQHLPLILSFSELLSKTIKDADGTELFEGPLGKELLRTLVPLMVA